MSVGFQTAVGSLAGTFVGTLPMKLVAEREMPVRSTSARAELPRILANIDVRVDRAIQGKMRTGRSGFGIVSGN